ncbi:MAG: CAP domain-containing protein [Patescibacteria group bacterium]
MPEFFLDKKNFPDDNNVGSTDYSGPHFFHKLFIPSQHNNYKPHALHGKRLAFYSLAAILIKALVVALALSFPIQAWLTPDLLSEESGRIVELTNNLRIRLNISPLRNNEVLQQAALAKAEDMLVNQYFAHVSPDKKGLKHWLQIYRYNYSVAGENLALGFSSPEAVVQAWETSPTHYANLIDSDYKDIGVAMIAGTYQGFDTTLVAQYFGTLKNEPSIETSTSIFGPENTLTPTSTSQTSTNAVLSSKDLPETSASLPVVPVGKPVLANPRLMSPADNFLTKDSKIHLVISAPRAEGLTVWVNKQAKWQGQVDFDKAETDLILPEGENKIILQADGLEQTVYSTIYTIKVDMAAPQVDQERTHISALQPSGQDQVVIKAEVYMSADTRLATIKIDKYNIDLQQDSFDKQKWTGHLIISEEENEQLSNPVVPASISSVDLAGNTAIEDISWGAVIPKETTPLSQYLFLKQNQTNYTAPLFDISSIYYKFILVLACLALLLNIFIEIKKQHPKTIASTMCFIALLVILILI